MRKNRVLLFLLAISVLLGLTFYIIANQEKFLSWEEVKNEAITKCETKDYEDAFNYLNNELETNPNCDDGTKGRTNLVELRDRIFKVKGISISSGKESEYIKEVKLLYSKKSDEKYADAKSKLEEGLDKFPNCASLIQLQNLLEDEGITIEVGQHQKNEVNRVKSMQTINSNSQSYPSQNKKPIETKTNESLPEKNKIINLSVDLSMVSQNVFSWNPKIAEEGLTTTLIITTGSGVSQQKDVTGLSTFKFKPGDTKFDGVKCTVKLLIESKEGVKIDGNKEIKVKTTC